MSMSIIESAEARGMSKGLAKGRAEGRAEGRVASLVDLIIRVLSKKYGFASVCRIENTIKASNGKLDLNKLVDYAYETNSLDDFFRIRSGRTPGGMLLPL